MNIAIITGASSGMGKEFVIQADKRYNLDEIWVIARSQSMSQPRPDSGITTLASPFPPVYTLTLKKYLLNELVVVLASYTKL